MQHCAQNDPDAAPEKNNSPSADVFRAGVRDNLGLFIFSSLLLIISSLSSLSIPMFFKQAVDRLENIGGGSLEGLVYPVLAIVAAAILQYFARIGSRLAAFTASYNVIRDIRRVYFLTIEKLAETSGTGFDTGDLISRGTNDLKYLRILYGFGVLQSVNAIIVFAVAISLMLSLDRQLTLLAIIPFPCFGLIYLLQARTLQRRSMAVNRSLGKLSSGLEQNVTGFAVVKSFTLEDVWRKKFATLNDRVYEDNRSLIQARSLIFSLASGAGGVGVLIVLYFGGLAVIDGRFTLGTLTAFISYMGALAWPAFALGWITGVLQRGLAAKKRVREVLDLPKMDIDWDREESRAKGEVELRGLSFHYPGDRNGRKHPVLNDISLHLAPGQTLGITGGIGSGKSTLLELIMRLIEPPAGTVFIDGCDVTKIEHAKVWSNFSYAPQESFLFSWTIESNITVGRQSLGNERLNEIVELAALDEELGQFSEGSGTVVGERGIKLSGGQRQRVGIARALASHAPILILDDVFSSVDYETEHKIIGNLIPRLAGRTTIIVSQRISILEKLDQVAVLENGSLVEHDSPERLRKTPGYYRELYLRDRVSAELEKEHENQ